MFQVDYATVHRYMCKYCALLTGEICADELGDDMLTPTRVDFKPLEYLYWVLKYEMGLGSSAGK